MPKLLYFHFAGCKPCQVVKPELDRIKDRFVFQPVDVMTRDGEDTARKYGVSGCPTVIVIDGEHCHSYFSASDILAFCRRSNLETV